jgi:serine/threonine protein kinase
MRALEQLIGEVLDEKYRIDKLLGKGGMGAVYLATHLGTDRPVALKVITPQFTAHEEFVERFRREAKAAGRLRHPNVVDVTDFGFAPLGTERVAYLVMEYLDGCTLAEVLQEESRLPLSWAVDILEQTCSAVDEAHQQGIVHRDLKPDNIWLEPNRRGGYTVKVLDFGLAKLADANLPEPAAEETSASSSSPSSLSSLPHVAETIEDLPALSAETLHLPPAEEAPEAATRILSSASQPAASPPEPDAVQEEDTQTRRLVPRSTAALRRTEAERGPETAIGEGLTRVGSILGTPLYMSPEQCRGERLDARSDIYSLGVMAYQMLAGETPFTGDMPTVMQHHLATPPPPLREKNPRIPKKVAHLVMSALAKDPAERPASAAALASAIRAYAEGAGALLRRAFALYSEHMPTFLLLAVLVGAPLVAVNVAKFVVGGFIPSKPPLPVMWTVVAVVLSIIELAVNFMTHSVIAGVTALLVAQLMAAPLRPIQIRPALRAVRARLWPFVWTTLLVGLLTFLGMVFLVIPGLLVAIHYSTTAPVVLIEGLKGRAAMRRAKTLAKRDRRTVTIIVLLQIATPFLTSALIAAIIAFIVKALKLPEGTKLVGQIQNVVFTPLSILIVSVSSVITALLYLKLRQAGGESLKEVGSPLEDESAPLSRWQARMRERLRLPTPTPTRR